MMVPRIILCSICLVLGFGLTIPNAVPNHPIVIHSQMNDFTISINESNDTLSKESSLIIESNGSARYEYWYNLSDYKDHQVFNGSLLFSKVNELYGSLQTEKFFSLSDKYQVTSKSITNLTLAQANGTKTVSFGGWSMYGILPRTSVLIQNLQNALIQGVGEAFNASIEIAVREIDSNNLSVNVSVRNNENFTLYGEHNYNYDWSALVISSDGKNSIYWEPPGHIEPAFAYWTVPPHSMLKLRSSFIFDRQELPNGSYVVVVFTPIGNLSNDGLKPDYCNFSSFDWHGFIDKTVPDGNDQVVLIVIVLVVIAAVTFSLIWHFSQRKKSEPRSRRK